MTAATFLAIRCLMELAELNEDDFPAEAFIIRNDMYVDDVLAGSSSVENLKEIKRNLVKILGEGNFQLKKFRSNYVELGDVG